MPETSQNPKVGRPPVQIDPEHVRVLAAADLTIAQIAQTLRISEGTLYRYLSSNPELKAAVEQGREIGNAALLRKAWSLALGGDSGMLRFLIKNRIPGYNDSFEVKGQIQHRHTGSVAVGHVSLGSMTLEDVEARLAQLKPEVVKYLAERNSPQEGQSDGRESERLGEHAGNVIEGTVVTVDERENRASDEERSVESSKQGVRKGRDSAKPKRKKRRGVGSSPYAAVKQKRRYKRTKGLPKATRRSRDDRHATE